mgnify:CR=1 FL=1
MEIYLVRHTTPAINNGICYGQTDVDLNSEELLSTYIEGTASGFEEMGSMLKRVDATNSNGTIDLNDPDFEEFETDTITVEEVE